MLDAVGLSKASTLYLSWEFAEVWGVCTFLEFCVGQEAVGSDNERMRAVGDETKGRGRQ